MTSITRTPDHTGRPEKDAVALLKAAWAQRYPEVTPVPVDPIEIAQGLGLQVLRGNLPDNVSGMLVKHAGRDPIIYLNGSQSEVRQRFTCAHELGHYVERAASDDDEWEYVDMRDQRSSQGVHRAERYANGFAAALLMPAEAVKELVHQGQADVEMASRFEVSLEAMRHRLSKLHLSTG